MSFFLDLTLLLLPPSIHWKQLGGLRPPYKSKRRATSDFQSTPKTQKEKKWHPMPFHTTTPCMADQAIIVERRLFESATSSIAPATHAPTASAASSLSSSQQPHQSPQRPTLRLLRQFGSQLSPRVNFFFYLPSSILCVWRRLLRTQRPRLLSTEGAFSNLFMVPCC